MPARQPFMMYPPQSMPPAGRFPFARPPMGMQPFQQRRPAGPRAPRGPPGEVAPAGMNAGPVQMGGMPQNRPRGPGGNFGRQQAARVPGRGQRRMPAERIKDLAVENPESARRVIGETLYGFVLEYPPAPGQEISSLAGKITGMLLEGLDMSELLHLVESRDAANSKIGEAYSTLMEAGRA